ncbi:MAG: hypothetical protein V4739_04530 [Pseudomonadota bacterium]
MADVLPMAKNSEKVTLSQRSAGVFAVSTSLRSAQRPAAPTLLARKNFFALHHHEAG